MPQIVTSILQIISLYSPSPSIQFQQNFDFSYSLTPPNSPLYQRDTTVASAGFSNSFDFYNNPIPAPSPFNIPIPSNAYLVSLPSQVYGTPTSNDTYNVLQINTALVNLEPGFNRIRVDYTSLSGQNYIYFDIPYYEGWNVTARELNNIVEFVAGGIGFLQQEINTLNLETGYALTHEFWRGISVSGELSTTTPINVGLQTGPLTRQLFSHTLPEGIDSKCIDCQPKALESKSDGINWETVLSSYVPTGKSINQLPSGGNNLISSIGIIDGGKLNAVLYQCTDGSIVLNFYDTNWDNGTNYYEYQFIFYFENAAANFSIDQCAPFYNPGGENPVYAYAITMSLQGPSSDGQSYAAFPYGFYGSTLHPSPPRPGGGINVSPIKSIADGGGLQYPGPGGNQTGPASATYFIPSYIPNSTQAPYNDNTNTQNVQMNTVPVPGSNYYFCSVIFVPVNATLTQNSNTCTTLVTYNFSHRQTPTGFEDNDGDWFGTGYGHHAYLGLYSLPANTSPTITSINPPSGNACIGQQVVVNGSNFSNTWTCEINSANYVLNTSNSQLSISPTQITFNYPAGFPTGNVTFTLVNSQNMQQNPVTYPMYVVSQPNITSINGIQVGGTINLVGGATISINGSGFGSQNSTTSVIFNGTSFSIVSWSDTIVQVLVPYNITGTGTLYLTNQCGNVATANVNIIQDTLVVTPLTAVVPAPGGTQQFTATFNSGVSGNITNQVTWTLNVSGNGHSTWTTIGSGNSTYGFINSNGAANPGLYIAPNANPPGQSPNNPVIEAQASYYDSNINQTLISTSTITINGSAALAISPPKVSIGIPTTYQFYALLSDGFNGNNPQPGGLGDVSEYAQWYINGTLGGNNTYGTINSGYYNTPIYLPVPNNIIVAATYIYNGSTYTASATATLITPPVSAMVLQAQTQINIYLGDGRFGYIPQGQSCLAYLNQYVYVQFQELLDTGLRNPDPTYLPIQQLTMQTKDALDSDIANVVYDLGNIVIQPDGNVLTTRTVILGIIDPSDGKYHSMWDIANPSVTI